jgi:hypothetical protein
MELRQRAKPPQQFDRRETAISFCPDHGIAKLATSERQRHQNGGSTKPVNILSFISNRPLL